MWLEVDDSRVFAYSAGHAIKPSIATVVFLHGAGHDHSVWALQSRYFAYHGLNVLALDLPAHGRSTGHPLETVQDMSAWVVAVLDAAKVQQATLVGHSLGSLIALDCAASHPQRIARIALLGAALSMPVSAEFLSAAQGNARVALDMHTIWGHSPQMQIGGDPVPGTWTMGQSRRLVERSRPGVLHADLAACHAYSEGETAAARVTCPALLMLATRDIMTPPKAGAAAARMIPRAKAIWLQGAGHAMMSEQPDAVLDALIDFVVPAEAGAR